MKIKNVFGSVSQSYNVSPPPPDLRNGPKHETYLEKNPSLVLDQKDATYSEKSAKNSGRKLSFCGSISHTIVTNLEQFFYR